MIRTWLKPILNLFSTSGKFDRPGGLSNSINKSLVGNRKPNKRRSSVLQLERLEERETPAATITSSAGAFSILTPYGETAVLNLGSTGQYTVTDSNGVSGTGGTIAGNTFTAIDPAAGQKSFTIAAGSGGTVQLGAGSVIPSSTTVTLTSDSVSIASASANGGTVTIRTTAPFTVAVGQQVQIIGVDSAGTASGFNGMYAVSNVSSPTMFQYSDAAAVGSAAGSGTVTISGTLDLDNASDAIDGLDGNGTIMNSQTTQTSILTIGSAGSSGNFGGAITGFLSLVKTGGGAETLSGASTYFSGTVLAAGTLLINSNTAIGGGTLTIDPGTTIDNGSGAPVSLSNPEAWNGSFTFAGSAPIAVEGNVTLGNNVTVSSNGTNTPLEVDGQISDGGSAFGLTLAGSGELILTGTNTYSGGTTIRNGTLNINADGALGAAGAGVDLAGGSLQFALGSSATLNNGRTITLAGGVFDTNGANATIDGIVTGNGNLVKNGLGILTLANQETYSGATTVNAGTLIVNGALLNSGAVMVNSGANLGGSGSIAAPITMNGALMLGADSELTATTVKFGASGSFNVVLDGTTPGNGYGQLAISGTIDLSNSPNLYVTLGNGFTAPPGMLFTIVATPSNGHIIGNFKSLPNHSFVTSGSQSFQIEYDGITLLTMMHVEAPMLTSVVVNGNTAPILSASAAGGVATIVTDGPSGFSMGQNVLVAGVDGAGTATGFNGPFVIASVSGNMFTYNDGGASGNCNNTGTATLPLSQAAGGLLSGGQRSMVDSIIYTFSEPVTLGATAVTIGGIGEGGSAPGLSYGTPDGGTTWVITFTGVTGNSIGNGEFSTYLDNTQVIGAGGPLASSDTESFYRLYGDTIGNGHQRVNTQDTNTFLGTFNTRSTSGAFLAFLDYNDDGRINTVETNAFLGDFNMHYTNFTATI